MQPPLFEGGDNIDAHTRHLQTGQTSCRVMIESCLASIGKLNEVYGAWNNLLADKALTAADRLDDISLARPALPLWGVPIGVKDLIEIAGVTPSFGSRAWPSSPAQRDAPLIERLQRAGAIVVGTTQLVEFAFGSWGTNAVMGTPRNPADMTVHRVPGGSSSGSAVAAAAGMVPAALGSDTGGSVRIPAALCGVIGYKPPTGTIPMQGVLPLSPTLDTIGPLGRTVADVRRIDAVMSGREHTPLQLKLGGLHVALIDHEQWGEVQQEVRLAVQEAAQALKRSGCRITQLALPQPLAAYQALTGQIMAAEAYRFLAQTIDDSSAAMDENVRSRIIVGKDIGPDDLAAAKKSRMDHLRQFHTELRDIDAFLLPTTPSTAIAVADVDEAQIPMSRLTRFANYLDLAALSVPFGLDSFGLPIGVQLAGFGHKCEVLFAMAAELERYSARL